MSEFPELDELPALWSYRHPNGRLVLMWESRSLADEMRHWSAACDKRFVTDYGPVIPLTPAACRADRKQEQR